MNPRSSRSKFAPVTREAIARAERDVLNEVSFQRMISLERMRTQRSGKPLLLMLLDIRRQPAEDDAVGKVLAALTVSTRETDVTGWYEANATVGVLFTELAEAPQSALMKIMLTRISEALESCLTPEQFDRISTSFHFFPEHSVEPISPQAARPVAIPTTTFVPAASGETAL